MNNVCLYTMPLPVLRDVIIEADLDVDKLLDEVESSRVVELVVHVCNLQYMIPHQRCSLDYIKV